MLFLRISILLALGFCINTTTASENLDNAIASQKSQPIVVARKRDSRQRSGECGIPPNVWALNICETYKFCYSAQDKVSLWLKKRPAGAVRVRVENTKTADSIELRWKTSAKTWFWPVERLPIQSDVTYWIEIKTRNPYLSKAIILQQMPVLKTTADKAVWMENNGCASQAYMIRKGISS